MAGTWRCSPCQKCSRYGGLFRLRRHPSERLPFAVGVWAVNSVVVVLVRGIYAVERSAALQRARAIVSRRRTSIPADSETRRSCPYLPVECANVDRTVGLQAGKKSAFKSSIVIDTLPPSSRLGVLSLTQYTARPSSRVQVLKVARCIALTARIFLKQQQQQPVGLAASLL